MGNGAIECKIACYYYRQLAVSYHAFKAPPILSQEDRALNEALEASLTSSFVGSQEPYEEPTEVADRVRKEGRYVKCYLSLLYVSNPYFRPLAFREMSSSHCYVSVVLQCLLSVPKIQERLLEYDPNVTADEEAHGTLQYSLSSDQCSLCT
jgi:hypothetical protein